MVSTCSVQWKRSSGIGLDNSFQCHWEKQTRRLRNISLYTENQILEILLASASDYDEYDSSMAFLAEVKAVGSRGIPLYPIWGWPS